MTKGLARAVETDDNAHTIVRQQLKATQNFIAENRGRPMGKKFELMRLPYDVRHLVLEHLIRSQRLRVFLRNCKSPIPLPEAARAGNVQLRRECLLVTLKLCTVEIHSGWGNAALQAWLSKIDLTGIDTFCKTGYDAITTLDFPYFSRFPYGAPGITNNNDVELALACKNLRSLSMDFQPEELYSMDCRHCGKIFHFAAKCALDIRESYQLDGLLGASKLERLYFDVGGYASLFLGLTEVADWFKKGFQERGQKVIVEFH